MCFSWFRTPGLKASSLLQAPEQEVAHMLLGVTKVAPHLQSPEGDPDVREALGG